MTLPLPRPGELEFRRGALLSSRSGGPGGRGDRAAGGPKPSGSAIQPKRMAWRRARAARDAGGEPWPGASNLLIPGDDGRAYLIDPLTAQSKAEPLVPVFDRDRRGRWLAPAGSMERASSWPTTRGACAGWRLKPEPVPRLVVEAENRSTRRSSPTPRPPAGP